jgi:hypothetical protein
LRIVRAARRGAWVLFGGIAPETIEAHVGLVQMMKSQGLLDRVLISHGCRGYDVGEKRGGKIRHYDCLFKQFLPAMFRAGFVLDQVEQLTALNPARAFHTRVRPLRRATGASGPHGQEPKSPQPAGKPPAPARKVRAPAGKTSSDSARPSEPA